MRVTTEEMPPGAAGQEVLDGAPLYFGAQSDGSMGDPLPAEGANLTPHDIDTRLKGPHSLAIADLNGDGKPDVVTVAKDSRVAAWFENDGKGQFKEHPISSDQSAYDIRLVDMNNDRDLDLLVAGFESKNVVWYENRIRK